MSIKNSGGKEFKIKTVHKIAGQASIRRLLRPFQGFLAIESASGIILLACTIVALVLANSAWSEGYSAFWHTKTGLIFGTFSFEKPLLFWINDGLMALFFFVAGMEIKREIVSGELRDPRKAALPILAALGGMICPAFIYYLICGGHPGSSGWGIPMATDIAFAIGFLALLGKRVPLGLKIFLLTLAIADDIGAIVVIACFYSNDVSIWLLGLSAIGFGITSQLNRMGVRSVPVYFVVGMAIWVIFLLSGVHPTVAGVLLGLLTPASAWFGERSLGEILQEAIHRLGDLFDGDDESDNESDKKPLIREIEFAAKESVSPLERLESMLHPCVAFLIMPVFALANAGVAIEVTAVRSRVAFAVAAGLIVGKPLGVVLFSWLAVKFKLAKLPDAVNWKVMLGVGWLAGIGFTMSLFVSGLALDSQHLEEGKLGTLVGSSISALIGSLLLFRFLSRPTDRASTREQTSGS